MDGSKGSEGNAPGGEAPGHSRGTPPGSGAPLAAEELARLARDWIELWQSELTALAADPETAETWARLASLWAGAAAAGLGLMPRGVGDDRFAAAPWLWTHPGAHPAWPAQAPRPAPAASAPSPGGVAPDRGAERGIERLLERVLDRLDGIEQRIAELEQRRGGGAGGPDRKRPRRGGA
ncbi:hypothetical protein [Elioraea rosea]|uniref:hypothetical protein n=1 Tax=Elioraea rosea TaxID=2492390 RepID=UPI001EF427C8|nr:hypothetical protein [Elioraea rosea]